MVPESVEDYLGAIYRLRQNPQLPLPLSSLQDYFGFSRVSIHEMTQRLEEQGFITYQPYRGACLTEKGEDIAVALLRRHRLWERFLTDMLGIAWDEAHQIAGQLEHAAPEVVTERLASLMGDPEACPHGAPIPPHHKEARGKMLADLEDTAGEYQVVRVFPEQPEVLQNVQRLGIKIGSHLQIIRKSKEETLAELEDKVIVLHPNVIQALWVIPI